MKLDTILKQLPFGNTIHGNTDVEIEHITLSSKDVKPNSCFFAVKGTNTDGHGFINAAIEKGATVIICEESPVEYNPDVTYVVFTNSSAVVGPFAAIFYGNPSSNMKVVGVTGTNGKTTVATLIYKMLNGFHRKAGLISTVENIIDGTIIESTHTTPDAITLQSLLARMHQAGCEYVVMEVSSHSVVQHRIDGINFTGAIFTNLTHDHLDYHHTIENYAAAKKMFFDNLPSSAFSITNTDDKYGREMVKDTKASVFTYGFNNIADFNEIIESKLVGQFNQYNLLATYVCAVKLGFEDAHIKKILKEVTPPRGRFELVVDTGEIRGIVDYAHTPDGIQNVLEAAKGLAGQGNVIAVLGCGGDRDTGKRPVMARIAYDIADSIIFTSDNPRNEDPDNILAQMYSGLPEDVTKPVVVIVDRQMAIKHAKEIAQPGDIIMLLGKGHETYQEINGVRNHFDDKEQLTAAFS